MNAGRPDDARGAFDGAADHTPDQAPACLWHFSEDPAITRFVPHVPPTNPTMPPYVWTIADSHAPLFWFPRDCPRVTWWPPRIHATEWAWYERMRSTVLYAYRFDPAGFVRLPNSGGAWVNTQAVQPAGVEPVGNLIARHDDAGIELRFLESLWDLKDEVVARGGEFSISRWRSAAPRMRLDAIGRDGAETWIAERDDGEVGRVTVRSGDDVFWPDTRGAAVRQPQALYVSELAGPGEGAHLVAWLERKALRSGCDLVRLDCDAANTDLRRRYESLGFSDAGEISLGTQLSARYEKPVLSARARPVAAS